MICQLCLQEKRLIKSHIIPDFMYKGLFDENHKTSLAKINPFVEEKRPSTGFYDRHILCLECDRGIIGKYEDYASKALYGGKLQDIEQPRFQKTIDKQNVKSLIMSQISYAKFKLFILSILWRSSITKNEFFKNVSLGKHKEIIRQMILSGNPGKDSIYETSILFSGQSEEILTEMIIEPRRITKNGNTFYLMLINKVFYYINISEFNKNELVELTCIKSDNTMQIPIIEGELLRTFYDSYLGIKLRYCGKK